MRPSNRANRVKTENPFIAPRPEVGMLVNFRGEKWRIIAVYSFGTIDIEKIDCPKRVWRMTGLNFL